MPASASHTLAHQELQSEKPGASALREGNVLRLQDRLEVQECFARLAERSISRLLLVRRFSWRTGSGALLWTLRSWTQKCSPSCN